MTFIGDTRLWYESLRLIAVDWNGSDSNTPEWAISEPLFHVWRSFHFDETLETTDSYVTCIRQVEALLGYHETHVLEVLRKKSIKCYWILFVIEDLRQAVETAERILIKEKIDRQLAGQSTLACFINVKDSTGCNKTTIMF